MSCGDQLHAVLSWGVITRLRGYVQDPMQLRVQPSVDSKVLAVSSQPRLHVNTGAFLTRNLLALSGQNHKFVCLYSGVTGLTCATSPCPPVSDK